MVQKIIDWSLKKMVLANETPKKVKMLLDSSRVSSKHSNPCVVIDEADFIDHSDSLQKKNMQMKQECVEDKELMSNIL